MDCKSTYHEAHEINAFYTEMVDRLKFLKSDYNERKKQEYNDFKLDVEISEQIQQSRRIAKILDEINNLDKEINENYESWIEMKKERIQVQQVLCDDIKNSEQPVKNSQIFVDLCNFENSPNKEKVVEVEPVLEKESSKQNKHVKKNFVQRNIELAKSNTMATFSLTDEEKAKLDSLLSDIDSEEYAPSDEQKISKSDNKNALKTENYCNFVKDDDSDVEDKKDESILLKNGFKFSKEEEDRLVDLETKMEELLSNCSEKFKEDEIEEDKSNILDDIESSGKLWKYEQIDKRLKDIDKELATIAAKDVQDLKEKHTIVVNEEEQESDENKKVDSS